MARLLEVRVFLDAEAAYCCVFFLDAETTERFVARSLEVRVFLDAEAAYCCDVRSCLFFDAEVADFRVVLLLDSRLCTDAETVD